MIIAVLCYLSSSVLLRHLRHNPIITAEGQQDGALSIAYWHGMKRHAMHIFVSPVNKNDFSVWPPTECVLRARRGIAYGLRR